MKNLKCLPYALCIVFVIACFHVVSGQSMEDKKLAAITAVGSGVRWDVAARYSALTMTVSAPDGRVFRKVFEAGSSPEFMLTDKLGERLPDGPYTYELRLTPVLSGAVKETLKAARGKDDDAEEVRAARKPAGLPALVQSGTFSILNGVVIVAGAQEEAGSRPVSKIMGQRLPGINAVNAVTKNEQHHPLLINMPDQVIPDDLIVQGSACVGLDCVNNENFGFDTIRLKENNDRIQFDDTSTAAGFPTNNWQIRANSSASGGASFLGFVDQGATGNSETGTIVFEVDAGAPANSLKVSSAGKVGLRTATPVLDVHVNTSDTPAMRFEQNSGGGFTAQTWDVAGNEANFFVRDVTGGSRLPFRIRPGAPTSSIDISATGNVGVGTASPAALLSLHRSTRDLEIRLTDAGGTAAGDVGVQLRAGTGAFLGLAAGGGTGIGIVLDTNNNVGIGTIAPDQKLSVNGDADKTGGNTWLAFSDERLKNIKGNFNSGLKAVMQLQPIRYEYLKNNALGLKSEGEHIGFGAQAVQKVIPEAVTKNSEGYLMVNGDPIIWTMLNAIKEQQKEIEQLRAQIRQLRSVSRRRR